MVQQSLKKILTESRVVVFSAAPRCIRCSLARLLSGQRPVIREKGEKGRQLAAGDHYGALLQTGIVANFFEILTFFFTGIWSRKYFAMSWPSLGLIRPISSEKSKAKVLYVGFSIWSVPDSATKGIPNMRPILNQPINASGPLHFKPQPSPHPARKFWHFCYCKRESIYTTQQMPQGRNRSHRFFLRPWGICWLA